MRLMWKALIYLLPLSLLILKGNDATPVSTTTEVSMDPELVFRNETDHTKLENATTGVFTVWGENTHAHTHAKKTSHSPTDFSTANSTTESQSTQESEFESSTTDESLREDASKSLTRNFSKQQWGSYPIGTREEFALNSASSKYKWIAYFYEQAVATVLLDDNSSMMKCTVQENIQPWEQEAALEYLGDLMPLVPLDFNNMMHLITVCGSVNMPILPYSSETESTLSWWNGLAALQGILPGTLWCGMRDQANYYYELGPRQKEDNCCRAHDLCPIKVMPWNIRYGVSNMSFRALLDCGCDLEFYRCLKAANTSTADMVGKIYFNYLQIQCLHAPATQTPKMAVHWPYTEKAIPLPSALLELSDNISKRSLDPDADSEVPPEPEHESPEPSMELTYQSDQELESRKDLGRFDCVKNDSEGGCRKWVLSPQDFTVQLISRSLDVIY